jgi:hypothetical protein
MISGILGPDQTRIRNTVYDIQQDIFEYQQRPELRNMKKATKATRNHRYTNIIKVQNDGDVSVLFLV